MQTISDIFAIWPNPKTMAEELDYSYSNVAKWRQRQTLPPHVWPAVIQAAAARGVILSPVDLLRVNPTRKRAATRISKRDNMSSGGAA